uniref:BPI2 domain-containing protein n=1 Tax=Loa loa TaxID=7209 RepID=A0A1I7VB39_LOALO
MHLIKVFATPDYFQFGLRAAFTPNEMDNTPFHPFPMHFPQFQNNTNKRMNDVIMLRVGPETPKLGGLLKTTCSDEDYDDLIDSDIDDDEEFDDEKNSTVSFGKFMKRRKRSATNDDSDNNDNDKIKSKEDEKEEDILGDLGVCIGDIMPAIREKYPKKLIHIKVYSKRTPFVTLMAKDNGIARVDLELEAALYIDDSGEKVGTMLISSIIDGNIQISANRIVVLIKIQSLKLIDKEETLGLPLDALENLANLSKDIIAQTANSELSKGITVELITDKLPYHLVKPQFSIVDHAVHISTDISIPASIFGITSSTICRRL